jgi:uncharacterized protein YlzI (FlbEa/FlbD family)
VDGLSGLWGAWFWINDEGSIESARNLPQVVIV